MENLAKEVLKTCQQFRELRSTVKKWKEGRETTIRLIKDIIPNARKSHQMESMVIMATSLGVAGLVGASIAGYPNLGIVLVAAGAITGNYVALPTLTAKVGRDFYFNKVDVERTQKSLTQDKECSEQMNKLLSEFTLSQSCDCISQMSSPCSSEQAFTIVLACCECVNEDGIHGKLNSLKLPSETTIPCLRNYIVDARKVEVDLLQVVESKCAEAKLMEITDVLISDVKTVQELINVLTRK